MSSSAQRTVVIGDVHGCIDELDRLLAAVSHAPDDRTIFVGDLVAKGPNSQAVVQRAREIGALTVRGNHDHGVLRCVHALRDGTTLEKAKPAHFKVASTLRDADVAYLERTPLFLDLPELGVWVVHAGVAQGVALQRQNEGHLMTMRSVRPDGSISSRLRDGVPWASIYAGPAHVVFGHDAVSGLQQYPFATGLDTGCVYGRKLTALILPERRLVQVQASRAYREIAP
jgi:hypothetical protein